MARDDIQDARVDAYIAAAPDFARPILTHLRGVVHSALPDVTEAIKWSMPHFVRGGSNLAGMAAFKAHAAFVIHGDGRQGGPAEAAMGQFGKLTTLADLPGDDELIARLRHRAESGPPPRPPRAARAELPIPVEFAAALAEHPAAAAMLAAFAPSHRREYVEWISEAKTAPTRERRIAQAIEWLTAGRKRNWQYERC